MKRINLYTVSVGLLILGLVLYSCNKDESSSIRPTANFEMNETTIFRGDSIAFTDQSSGFPTSWVWDFGDGNASFLQNPVHKFNSRGIFTVKLIVTNELGSDSLSKTDCITVNVDYGSVTDYDNNVYRTVTLGTQVWMAENLKVTHYPDGTEIPNVTNDSVWANNPDDADAFCYYNNDPNTENGALYNFHTAQRACPTGWHVPTYSEWSTMTAFLGSEGHSGEESIVLRSTSGWEYFAGACIEGTDNYGFTMLSAGNRDFQDGDFFGAGHWSYILVETDLGGSLGLGFLYDMAGINYCCWFSLPSNGYTVRCVKD